MFSQSELSVKSADNRPSIKSVACDSRRTTIQNFVGTGITCISLKKKFGWKWLLGNHVKSAKLNGRKELLARCYDNLL